MAISLFKHNQDAYNAAVAMLAETGKAAVIHPTGTGKSFIGFKLCEDNPDKNILWLSPSEYIFKTQLENLADVSNGWKPENIRFLTYAKLMNMSREEIGEIKPYAVVFDEYHRAGAVGWSKGIESLLKLCPDTLILGLSATNIRYLDNQRDMADELFDGNIASQMTLGEAIVRGILNAPEYVLSVFSYEKELEKYEKRVSRVANGTMRNAATEYLNALRRAIEKANGLDEIFNKHMKNRTGKYIVFCSCFEAMTECMGYVSKWFCKVDKNPKIYSVYSGAAGSSKTFSDFVSDCDNTHLRLLFCIDALNEGIHIMRWHSKAELALHIFRGKRKGKSLSEEQIKKLESVGFKGMTKKEERWEANYELLKAFYDEHGHCNISVSMKSGTGGSLYGWISNQKQLYKAGKMLPDRIEKFRAVGII